MSDKEKDIEQLIYRELPPDRYCYIHNYIVDLKNQLQQKENIIKELKERSLQYSEEIDRLLDIKEKVRDILKRHICNPSGLKDGWHIDCWNNEDISKLNEDLEILEREMN